MDVFSLCMHTGDQRLMLNVLLSLPLPFCFGDRVSDWIWSSSIQLVWKTHRILLSLSPSAGLQACTSVHTWLLHGWYWLNSDPQDCEVISPAPTPLYASQILLFPFLTPALPSLFLHHTSLSPFPQAHQVPFYLYAFTCKVLPAPHPLPAKLLQIFVQISPLWRGLLLDISRSYSLSPMITGLISTAMVSYLLRWLPDYCFSLPAVSKLCAGRQIVSTLCSLSSQLIGKKESAHQQYCHCLPNDWTADCHALRTVPSSFPYIRLSADERGWEKNKQFFITIHDCTASMSYSGESNLHTSGLIFCFLWFVQEYLHLIILPCFHLLCLSTKSGSFFRTETMPCNSTNPSHLPSKRTLYSTCM